MIAAVCSQDTAPLSAPFVNSSANRLVPEFSALASPLESALTELSTSVHSKRLTQNLSRLDSALTKNRGRGVPHFVTTVEPSASPLFPKSWPFMGLRTLCTNQSLTNRRISSIFKSLSTLAKMMDGGRGSSRSCLSRRNLGEGRHRRLGGRTFRSDIKDSSKELIPQFCASVPPLDACADSVGCLPRRSLGVGGSVRRAGKQIRQTILPQHRPGVRAVAVGLLALRNQQELSVL